MPGVFISYRREDAPGHAGRVFDRLRARFGADVFMDVTGIEGGVDFVDAIEQAVGACDVLLAVIGPAWTTVADRAGTRRLDDPNDFIRLEIAKALQRKVRVVPVLVERAMLPAAGELPDELKPLLRRQAIELRDTHWDADVEQLAATIERIVARSGAAPAPQAPAARTSAPAGWRRLAPAAAVLVVAGVGGAIWGPRACAPTPDTASITGTQPATVPGPTSSVDPPAATNHPPTGVTPVQPKPPAPKPVRPGPVDPDATGTANTGTGTADPSAWPDAGARPPDTRPNEPATVTATNRTLGLTLGSPERNGVVVRGVTAGGPAATAGIVAGDLLVTAFGKLLVTAADDDAGDAARRLREVLEVTPPGGSIPFGVTRDGRKLTLRVVMPSAAAETSMPDVTKLPLAEARRRLAAANITKVDVRWIEASDAAPDVVVSQRALRSDLVQNGGVGLGVAARATVVVNHLAADGQTARTLVGILRRDAPMDGLAVRVQEVAALRPGQAGKVTFGEQTLARDASGIARAASAWLTREYGARITIEPETMPNARPRLLLFWLPPRR